MTQPFNFAADTKLPAALAARMQATANARADAGLISDDGQTHPTMAAKRVYDDGAGALSRAYATACRA